MTTVRVAICVFGTNMPMRTTATMSATSVVAAMRTIRMAPQFTPGKMFVERRVLRRMRKPALAALAAVLIALIGTSVGAQMKPQPKAAPRSAAPLVASGARPSTTTQFPRISIDDAYKLFASGKATFIDVRSNEQYSYGHIRGAINIPRSQIVSRFNEVMPGKTVITYCACGAEESSGVAAASLISHGVKNVFALKGGWAAWKSAGRPIAAGPK
jgi:rhodanese-related sulfurtransferase